MALQWVNRAGVLRHLHLGDALFRPSRVLSMQNRLRRLCISSQPQLKTARLGGLSSITSQRTHSFATDATTKPKRSTKSTDGKTKSITAKKTKSKTKAQSKPKPRRQLTEKQKEAKEKLKAREHLKELKETALTSPKKLPQSAYLLAVQDKMPQARTENQTQKEIFTATVEVVKGLSPLEQERYQHQADQNKATNEAAYADWVQSHTPLQIKAANIARRHLAKLLNKPCRLIKDERLVKRPGTAYIQFAKERNQSGDFKHMPVPQISLRIRDEWNNLTESEKEPYTKLAVEDKERYIREHQEVYGEPAKFAAKSD